jgi:hypothetical protein
MSPPKNGTRLTVAISIGIGLITALATIGSIIYAVGGYSGKIDKHEEQIAAWGQDSKRIEELERKAAIFSTQIVGNEGSIEKLFVNQNMMRKEIQTNAEGKLNRDDFFRIQSETSKRFESVDARLLYLERHQIDLDLHEEVHSP